MRGDEDFFSVASTIPLVAVRVSHAKSPLMYAVLHTFDTQRRYALVDSIQRIF